MVKCQYCSRQASHEHKDKGLFFCDSCADAFRDGFEKGRRYECARRRRDGR